MWTWKNSEDNELPGPWPGHTSVAPMTDYVKARQMVALIFLIDRHT